MRVGEITALKWKEVDFDKKLLWIKLAQYMGEFDIPRLGHADMRTTARWYIHMQSQAEREGAQVASQLLEGSQQGLLWSSDGLESTGEAPLAGKA